MNTFVNDSRVLKEIESLAAGGYYVILFALRQADVPKYEEAEGYQVIRLWTFTRSIAKLAKFVKHAINLLLVALHRARRLFSASYVAHEAQTYDGLRAQQREQSAKSATHKSYTRSRIYIVLNYLVIASFNWNALLAARRAKADYYHANDLNTVVAALLANKLYGGKGVVYDSHELYPEMSRHGDLEKRMLYWVDRACARRASAVITVNESIAQEFQTRYNISKPYIVLNSPPLSRRPSLENTNSRNLIRSQLPVADDAALVIYQGGFSPNRGLENLLRSFLHLDDVFLVMMGWGPLEEELHKIRDDLMLEHKVYFIPPVPQKELLHYTGDADIGVIPYQAVGLNNFYTTPNKLFEYILAGIPVAASNFPELKRFLGRYDIGYTFDPNDIENIASVIRQTLAAKDKLSLNLNQAAKELSWEQQEKTLLRVYEAVGKQQNAP